VPILASLNSLYLVDTILELFVSMAVIYFEPSSWNLRLKDRY